MAPGERRCGEPRRRLAWAARRGHPRERVFLTGVHGKLVFTCAPRFPNTKPSWGPVAQLIERVVRNDEVRGLIPLRSTISSPLPSTAGRRKTFQPEEIISGERWEGWSHLRETTFACADAWLLTHTGDTCYDRVTSAKPYWCIGPAFANLFA